MPRSASARSAWDCTAATSPNMGQRMLAAFPALASDAAFWDALDRLFMAMIVDRYEADTAFSFAHSLRRNICHEIWRPVAYSFPPPSKLRALFHGSGAPPSAGAGRIDTELIAQFLAGARVLGSIPRPPQAMRSASCAARELLYAAPDIAASGRARCCGGRLFPRPHAFVVGRWILADDSIVPFVVALLNSTAGSTPMPSCTMSRTFTICSARRWRISMSPPGSTTRHACFFSA